jgi:transcriptional regulator with XRE-family HTH domain
MNFGQEVRRLRKDKRWTVYDLAENLGVSTGYISKIENSPNLPNSQETLQKICSIFDKDISFFFKQDNDGGKEIDNLFKNFNPYKNKLSSEEISYFIEFNNELKKNNLKLTEFKIQDIIKTMIFIKEMNDK